MKPGRPIYYIRDRMASAGLSLELLKENLQITPEKFQFGEGHFRFYLYFVPHGVVQKGVVVYIHPGGWSEFTPSEFEFIGNRFAAYGYHTVSLGYRHAPESKYPAQAEDVFEGYNAAMKMLAGRGVDTSRVLVSGSSSGGHLSAILTFDKQMQQKYGVDPSVFRGMISLGGVMRFEGDYSLPTQRLFDDLFTPGYNRRLAEPYSIADGSQTFRVLCIHAENDPVVNIENQRQFVNKLNSMRPGIAQLYTVRRKNAYHGNLVAGIFFERAQSTKELRYMFAWIQNCFKED